jgi:hypothetical protein
MQGSYLGRRKPPPETTLDFFDEDDPNEGPEPARRRRRPSRPAEGDAGGGVHPSQQQIRTRQITLLGVAIVLLILLFLAFRGCLDARKERSFKNYVSDLSALTVETKQLSDSFFDALNGNSEGDIGLEAQVNGDRGAAQGLLDRAQNLDAPDQLQGAQTEIALSYQLRRDALDAIAEQLPTALGNQGANRAIRNITQQMQVFLASDVLYRRARQQIEQSLESEEIVVEGGVPESEFLPTGNNDPDYLSQDEIADLLSGAGGGGGGGNGNGGGGPDCDPGDDLVHGLGLVSTTAQPAGVALTADGSTTVPADGIEFEIAVQNQGEADESGIDVTLEGDYSGRQQISQIAAGETETVTIPPRPSPSSGDSGTLTVDVAAVCGEQVVDNNTATYELTFE